MGSQQKPTDQKPTQLKATQTSLLDETGLDETGLDETGLDETGSPREACGVFGVYAPGTEVSHLAFDGLYALQHRGQESAGMAATDGSGIMVVKDMGLVTNVFNEYKLAGLQGHLAIGHTRYSTTGSSTWHNAQPVYRVASSPGRTTPTEFALGHNGNLTNTDRCTENRGCCRGRPRATAT